MDTATIIIRLVITFVLSLIFGLERQKSHKPVGFGTFTFVSLGACALGVISVSDLLPNSIALLGATVTGIGFLGAGALIKGTDKVFGFTTASSIWLFAIFGLSVGIGDYLVGGIIYSMVWTVIFLDQYLELGGIGSYQRKINLVTNKIVDKDNINKHLEAHTRKHKMISLNINKATNEMSYIYLVEGKREEINKMIHNLFKESWIKLCSVE